MRGYFIRKIKISKIWMVLIKKLKIENEFLYRKIWILEIWEDIWEIYIEMVIDDVWVNY